MTAVVSRTEIEAVLPSIDLVQAIEEAFVAYSQGRCVVPPVGELLFEQPPGDAHIKYGYIKGDSVFVIKVAAGFYDNPKHGLPSSSGLVLVFDQHTGMPLSVLLDEGHLTNIRTAVAGAVAAKHLARDGAERVAVLGGGVQARLQVEMLGRVSKARKVAIWARRSEAANSLARELEAAGWAADVFDTPAQAVADADIVITATASHEPLIGFADLKPGVHVTAMGSDTPDKQELSADIIANADVVVADSIRQCIERGEIHHAIAAGYDPARAMELGNVIAGSAKGRAGDRQITVADLTGVAVQDIAIAKAVLAARAHRS